MAKVPLQIVESTWKEIVEGDEAYAARLGQQFADEQPELVEYIFGVGETLNEEAAELAVYVATVIWAMFERSHGVVPRVSRAHVESTHERNCDVFAELDVDLDDEEALMRGLDIAGVLRQPDILRYVYESLMRAVEEDEEEEDTPGRELAGAFDVEEVIEDEDDVAMLFVVLKSVVDCLDAALGTAPRAEA